MIVGKILESFFTILYEDLYLSTLAKLALNDSLALGL